MSERPFVHLHCHTHYSLLDGANRIPELVEHDEEAGHERRAPSPTTATCTAPSSSTASARTPASTRSSATRPTSPPASAPSARPSSRGDAGFHLTLLAKNATGFRNLIKMASIAFLEGYYYVPRIDKELLAAHKRRAHLPERLRRPASSASSSSRTSSTRRRELAEWFAKLFGKNFYVEIQNNGLDIQKQCAEGAIDIANQLGLPLVATCDAHYLRQDDAAAHDVLLCINTGRTLQGREPDALRQRPVLRPRRRRRCTSCSPDHADAVAAQPGDRRRLSTSSSTSRSGTSPSSRRRTARSPRSTCASCASRACSERYGDNPPRRRATRLEHELGIICRMGFASYFLIVWDFVRFARENGIPCTARGSACGAIVSYVLKLSHV